MPILIKPIFIFIFFILFDFFYDIYNLLLNKVIHIFHVVSLCPISLSDSSPCTSCR